MSYSNGLLSDQSYKSANKYVQGLPGVGFKLSDTGDYDMQNKKLVNVKNGVNGSDAVTKSLLDTKTSLLDGARTHGYIVNNKAVIYSQSGAVHAESFYLQDQNEDEVRILTDNQDFDNVHLFVPNLKNFDGFGGKKRSEIMVTSVDQTVSGNKFFQNIKAPNPSEDGDVANKNYVDFEITKQNVLIDNEFVKISGSLMTGDLILPHYNYPVQGNTNKAISYETQREIFISRKETFPMETSLDMNNNVIENIAEATSDHQALRKSQLDNALVIVNNDLSDKADKSYVDTEITKVHQNLDLAPFLKKDGQRSMTGDLNMDSHFIKNVGINLSDDSTVVLRSYVDSFVNSTILNPLDGDLFANNHQIKNLKTPSEDNDAVTKIFFEDKLLESHLLPSHRENAFKYLLDADESSSERNITVNGIVDFNNSPHKNKKAYDIDLIYTSGTQNYDSQIGINIYPLAIGKYTIIMEYYFPEDTGISLSCSASTAVIAKQTTKKFSDYMKLLVQFDPQTKDTPDYLYFDIRGSASTSTNPEGYLVFYGMKDWFNIVNPSIYDHALESSMFEYNNGFLRMNTNMDMNNHKISNLANAINGKDAVNKNQLDDSIKNTYKIIFTDNFYDLLDTFNFNLIPTSSNFVINGVKPDLFWGRNQLITLYDKDHGLQINNGYIKLSKKINQNTNYTIFFSIHLAADISINFASSTSSVDYFPQYGINYSENKLTLTTSSSQSYSNIYKSDFNNQQVIIWICYDNNRNLCRMGISNYKSYVQQIYHIQNNYQTDILKITYHDFIRKIGFIDKYIDFNGIEFAKIMLEEIKNGSYFL